jgi:hypothetical protein
MSVAVGNGPEHDSFKDLFATVHLTAQRPGESRPLSAGSVKAFEG